MKGRYMKRLLTVMLGVMMLLTVCGCSVSSTSTTTFSTSVTDENGKTTTNSTTNTTMIENGTVSSDTLVTSDDDPTGLRNKWHELFSQGAEGVSEKGNQIYFIYDDPEGIGYAAIMVLNEAGDTLEIYDFGEVQAVDGKPTIIDVDGEETFPFMISEKEVEGGFEMLFQDGDKAQMQIVDLDTIIDHMISIWESVKANSAE